MAISTKMRNKIVAEWKAGMYKSKNAVAKRYKIDARTVGKIVDGLTPINADIVEAGVIYESAKNGLKNVVEVNAIENAVQNRIMVHDISRKMLDKIDKMLSRGTYTKSMKVKRGENDRIEQFDQELTPTDLKQIADGIDKASITLGVNDRFAPKTEVNVQQDNKVAQVTEVKLVLDE